MSPRCSSLTTTANIISVERRVDHGNLQVSFNVSLHGFAVLMSDPAREAARSMKRAPICRDARNPLHNGVPWDVRSGCNNGRIGGVHHHQVPTVRSTREIGDEKSIECILSSGDMPPTFRCIPIVEASMRWIERMGKGCNSQSARHSS